MDRSEWTLNNCSRSSHWISQSDLDFMFQKSNMENYCLASARACTMAAVAVAGGETVHKCQAQAERKSTEPFVILFIFHERQCNGILCGCTLTGFYCLAAICLWISFVATASPSRIYDILKKFLPLPFRMIRESTSRCTVRWVVFIGSVCITNCCRFWAVVLHSLAFDLSSVFSKRRCGSNATAEEEHRYF